MLGMIYGEFSGRSDDFAPGGFSLENGYCPHGSELDPPEYPFTHRTHLYTVAYDVFKATTEAELVPSRIFEGTLG